VGETINGQTSIKSSHGNAGNKKPKRKVPSAYLTIELITPFPT